MTASIVESARTPALSGASCRSLSFKTRLLVGVAAAALIADDARADDMSDSKWGAHIDLGGRIGADRQSGEVEIFLPVWQDYDSLIFGNLRGKFGSDDDIEGNFGLGFRTQVNGDWILGANAFFDILDSEYDNTFIQGGVGLEALTEDWDFRVNGYFPESDREPIAGGGRVMVTGTLIQLMGRHEQALWGVDGEVGYRLPLFGDSEDFEVRVFAGGFYFDADSVQEIAGPRGRIEARIYDLDFLSEGSRLTFGGEVTHDDVRGTEGFGTARIRIPLQVFGNGGSKLTGLDRRMTDRIVRDHDIITNVGYGDAEDVFVEDLQNSTYTIRFAEYGGTGYGGYYSPDSLADILAASGPNDILVVDGSAGTYFDTMGIQLQDGQAFVGAGNAIKLTGADTGTMVYFTPKPGGSKPTLTRSGGGSYIISLAEDNLVNYLTLDGGGNTTNGIVGIDGPGNYIDNFFIRNNMIRDFTGDGVYIALNNPASRGRIEGNMIYDVAGDAIDVRLYAGDGFYSDFDLSILDNTMFDVGNDAVYINVTVANGSTFYNTIAINDNYARDITDDFVDIYNLAATSSLDQLTQDIEIDNNEARYLGGVGVSILNVASYYADIDQEGTIDITDNTIYRFNGDPEEGGIQVFNVVRYGAELYQTLNITGNSVADYFYNQDYGSGILVVNDIEPAGFGTGITYFRQEINIEDNTTNGFDLAGIAVYTHAHGGYPNIDQSQTINIIGNTANYNSVVGIGVLNDLYDGAYANQSVNIKYNTANYNGGDVWEDEIPSANIALINNVDDYGTVLVQSADISGNTANGADYNIYGGGTGILVLNLATYGGFIDQANTIDIDDNTVRNNEAAGIQVFNVAFGYGDAGGGGDPAYNSVIAQTLNIDGNYAYDNGVDTPDFAFFQIGSTGNYVYFEGDGINVTNVAFYDGELDLANTLNITNNTAVYNYDDGINVANYISGDGSVLSLTANIDDNTASGNDAYGIYFTTNVDYGGFADMAVSVSRNTVNYNDGNGIDFYTEAYSGTGGPQSVIIQRRTIDDNTIIGNGGSGIDVDNNIVYSSNDEANGKITITGSISGNYIYDNSDYGIYLESDIYGVGEFDVTLTLDDNTVVYNGEDGIQVDINAEYYARVFADFTISNSTITDNSGDGIDFEVEAEEYSFVDLDLEILDNYIARNSSDGVYVSLEVDDDAEIDASGSIEISGNTIVDNYDDGIHVYIYAAAYSDGEIQADFDILDNVIADNSDDGIYFEIDLDDDSETEVTADITIAGNNIYNNDGDGIDFDIEIYADDDGNVDLDLELVVEDNTIYNNGDEGIEFDLEQDGYAIVEIDARFENNTITYNAYDGINLDLGESTFEYAKLTGTIDFIGNTVSNNGGDGIDIQAYAAQYFYLDVDLQFTGNTVSYNGGGSAPGTNSALGVDNGIVIELRSNGGNVERAEMQVLFEDNTVNGNDVHGIVLYNYGTYADMTASFMGGGNVTESNGGYFFPYGTFGYGVLIYNYAGDQLVNLNGVGNDFGPNAAGYTTYSYSGGGTQTVLGP